MNDLLNQTAYMPSLRERITKSGFRLNHFAAMLGISPQLFNWKLNDIERLTPEEMSIIDAALARVEGKQS